MIHLKDRNNLHEEVRRLKLGRPTSQQTITATSKWNRKSNMAQYSKYKGTMKQCLKNDCILKFNSLKISHGLLTYVAPVHLTGWSSNPLGLDSAAPVVHNDDQRAIYIRSMVDALYSTHPKCSPLSQKRHGKSMQRNVILAPDGL